MEKFDLVIAGGTVYDGSGSEPTVSDIGLKNGLISEIGKIPESESVQRIDAGGLSVCPGFIDVHTHSDPYFLIEPSAPSKITQGVTTEIIGNCGVSAAPRLGAWRMPAEWENVKFTRDWHSVSEFRQLLVESRPILNVAMLIGHGNLRAAVLGYEGRYATAQELLKMMKLLEEGMDQGAIGLSSGLVYPPGMFAADSELEELIKVVGERKGIYSTHMASEGSRVVECVESTINLGRKTGAKIEISHLKTSGKNNWGKIGKILELIRSARDEGVSVCADRYPYTYSCTDLDVVFPAWAKAGGREAIIAKLKDNLTLQRIREDIIKSNPNLNEITIGTTAHPENMQFRGVGLLEASSILNMHPVDAILHITLLDNLETSAFFQSMSEENMFAILKEPYVMIGSDASFRAPYGFLAESFPHPRAYGTFPRFLRMAIDGQTVPLAEAIRKMTSLPASHFGLKNRGLLKIGAAADLVIFDNRTVRDLSTKNDPHQYAKGIIHVIVNGKIVMSDGRFSGERPGCVL